MKNKFDACLLRLKEQAGLPSNKEVAELLGLSEKAFSARRARDVFPEEKLYALAHKRPELNIDVLAVLTGISATGHAKIALLNRAADLLPDHVNDFEGVKQSKANAIAAMAYAQLPERHKALLLNFDKADEFGKQAIEATAKLAAK